MHGTEEVSALGRRWSHLVPAGGTVLDVACGDGRHMRWFASAGHPVTGVDRAWVKRSLPWRILAKPCWPTSRTGPGPSRAEPSTAWSSPTTCGGRCCPAIVQSVAPGGVLIYETFAARQRNRGQALAARLPAAARRTAARLRRSCAWWPTRTASWMSRRASCSASPPCGPGPRPARGAPLPALVRIAVSRTRLRNDTDYRQHRRAGHPDARRRQRRLPALRKLIDWHIAEGTDCIGVVGTTGESPTVDVEEHREIIRVSVEQAKGRVPIMAGCGANSTAEAIELARFARKVGADCQLQVVPYYNKPTQEGQYRHFKAIAEAVGDLPIGALQRARPHRGRHAARHRAAPGRRCPASSASRKPPATSSAPSG